jgi:hypothetical protein
LDFDFVFLFGSFCNHVEAPQVICLIEPGLTLQ